MPAAIAVPEVSLAEVLDAVSVEIDRAWGEGRGVELLFVDPGIYTKIAAARARECDYSGEPPRLFGLIVSPQAGLDPRHPLVR
jgi:hypothetical protein